MDNLKYIPVGKVKMSRMQYWKNMAVRNTELLKLISAASFLLGLLTGLFVGTF